MTPSPLCAAAVLPSLGPASTVRWRILALLMAFTFMNYVNRISISVASEEIRRTWSLSETEFGSVLSALILAYTLCMIPGGWLSDRLGARRSLLAMGFGTALFCALTGVLGLAIDPLQTALMLLMLRLVRGMMGMCTAPLFPAAGRAVSRWIPFSQRARANAMVTGAAMVGIACTYPFFGFLMKQVGSSSAFGITAIITAGLAVVWAFYAKDDPGQHPHVNSSELALIASDSVPSEAGESKRFLPSEPGGAKGPPSSPSPNAILSNRSLGILTVSYATVGYVEYLIFYWSEHYFKNVRHFSDAAGTAAAMIPPLCMGLCMPLGGWLSDRLMTVVGYRASRASVAIVGMVCCSAMLVAATLVTNDAAIVACFALSLAFMGLTEAPAWATAIDLGGDRAATSSAIANTGGNAGGALSPVVTPWVSALLVAEGYSPQAGWAWGMRLAALICLIGALLWLAIDASERHTS